MNSMAIRYGDDIIVVDAGMMFPDAELLGVDIVTLMVERRLEEHGLLDRDAVLRLLQETLAFAPALPAAWSAQMRALRPSVKPDPEDSTTRDYILYARHSASLVVDASSLAVTAA
jgi:hypothetical protein